MKFEITSPQLVIPTFSKIKVIICSALSAQAVQGKIFLPADGYLTKPVDVNVLVDMVNGLFKKESSEVGDRHPGTKELK